MPSTPPLLIDLIFSVISGLCVYGLTSAVFPLTKEYFEAWGWFYPPLILAIIVIVVLLLLFAMKRLAIQGAKAGRMGINVPT